MKISSAFLEQLRTAAMKNYRELPTDLQTSDGKYIRNDLFASFCHLKAAVDLLQSAGALPMDFILQTEDQYRA